MLTAFNKFVVSAIAVLSSTTSVSAQTFSPRLSQNSSKAARVSALRAANLPGVLEDYTENEFTPMNETARSGTITNEIQQLDETLKVLGSAFSYTTNQSKLYRGVNIPEACFESPAFLSPRSSCPQWARKYVTSAFSVEDLKSYTSTAWDPKKAFNMYNVQITYTNKCSKGVDLQAVRESWNEELKKFVPILDSAEKESEVLFPRNVQEMVLKVDYHKKWQIVENQWLELRRCLSAKHGKFTIFKLFGGVAPVGAIY